MLHLMVGLPGTGKTTLAEALARDLPALRLSADDLQLALCGDDASHADHNTRNDAIESVPSFNRIYLAPLTRLQVQSLPRGARRMSESN